MCRIRKIDLNEYGINHIDRLIETNLKIIMMKYNMAYSYVYDPKSNTIVIIENTARAEKLKKTKNITIDTISNEIKNFLQILNNEIYIDNEINNEIDVNVDNENEINI